MLSMWEPVRARTLTGDAAGVKFWREVMFYVFYLDSFYGTNEKPDVTIIWD